MFIFCGDWFNHGPHLDPKTNSARAAIPEWYDTFTSKTLCKYRCCNFANVRQCLNRSRFSDRNSYLVTKYKLVKAQLWSGDRCAIVQEHWICQCVARLCFIGRIRQWLVRSLSVVGYSFAFDFRVTLGLVLSISFSWIWTQEAPLEVSGCLAVVRVAIEYAWLSCWAWLPECR